MKERPLGLLEQAPVNDKQYQSFITLAEYNLSPVRFRMVRKQQVPELLADEALYEFRRYMGLYIVQRESVSMFSDPVDEVWHNAILHTRLYHNLCHKVYGYFLHHDPFEMPDPNPLKSWQFFEKLYTDLYGKPTRIWEIYKPRPVLP